MKKLFILVTLFSFQITDAQFLEKKENLDKKEGFFTFYYSEKDDEIYLEISELNKEFLYVNSLATGLGSNDIGLDRGQLGNEAVVRFKKTGNKLLLIQPNLKYRAVTENKAERNSVAEAFAKSVLFGFEIKEEKDSSYIIDLTPFLLQDAQGVSQRLQRGNHGTFKLNKSKSALAMERTQAFPDNVEFEALLTLEGEAKSNSLRSVLPNSENITVTQHHSFVKLPDDNFEPRPFHPASGAIPITYYDYSSPVYEPLEKKFIIRHRLERKDPEALTSEAVKPIIYYLDPGTPEPVRSALLEGAKWWAQGFEAIGFKDAYQVKMLPKDADPLDVRYNVIQWVHRSTRGWSYGASVVDPRTGEIIKGHVSLGSLRIRQDFMIAQALIKEPFAESDEAHTPMMELALARIRQLSAHEVGHTLGFTHNFAGSSDENASVMDYPHPVITLENGEIRITNAYTTGIGDWDKFTIKYSYAPVPPASDKKSFLHNLIQEAHEKELQFISDSDARATGGAHVDAHLWDNSANASTELERILKVREQAIENFSVDNIRTAEPYSVLEDVFVPLYFFHRYQTEAAVKRIGGLNYTYAVKGDGQTVVKVLEREEQEKALLVILKTLDADVLAIPADKLNLFPPRAYGFSRTREFFNSNTGVAFDALGAPATAGNMTLSLLLHPERAARLVQQKAINQEQMGLEKLLDELFAGTIKSVKKDAYLQEVQNSINFNVLHYVMNLAVQDDAIPQVKAIANFKLGELEKWLGKNLKDNIIIFQQYLREIKEFRENPADFKLVPTAPQIPDGSPIGGW